MQLLVTDAWLAKSHAIHLSGTKLVLATFAASFFLMICAAGMYHWVFLKGAREGWPIIGSLVRLVVKDEVEQRDRFMRENIDVMAKKLGEMQAKMMQIESLGERVAGLAGVNAAELKVTPGRGGPLVSGRSLSMQELHETIAELEQKSNSGSDILTLIESRLFEQKVKRMMLPTQEPVAGGNLGSLFGWRIDPISGVSALHEGLDFPAEAGTPIVSAAGGVVVVQEYHPQYGNLIEVDHGNNLITRYAHASKVYVKKGDLIRRGHRIADVGNSGRSTGPHLHFEVLVQGVPQNPQKFLSLGRDVHANAMAKAAEPLKTGILAQSLPSTADGSARQ